MLEDIPYELDEKKPLLIIPILLWAVIVGASIAAVFYSSKVFAEPVFQASAGNVILTFHKDKCELPAVSNLPHKLEWVEPGKIYKGCWGVRPDMGLVVMYFSDKTVGLVPIEALTPVSGV